jgi:tryptophan synthase alpha chain
MNRIGDAFARARSEGRLAFIPYVTAGDPDRATTLDVVRMLVDEGADIVELGVPFSDPLADGVTNQRASERALAAGMTLGGVLDLVAELRAFSAVPLVLFTYFNPIVRAGIESFARSAAAAGVDGVLVTDLPPEEGTDYCRALGEQGLLPIFMVSPTSGPRRLTLVAERSRGFIYYVSRPGVTGARSDLPPGLAPDVAAVRRAAGLPVVVGFGISRPEHLRLLAACADGAVVGSALVRALETHGGGEPGVRAVREVVRRLFSEPPGDRLSEAGGGDSP